MVEPCEVIGVKHIYSCWWFGEDALAYWGKHKDCSSLELKAALCCFVFWSRIIIRVFRIIILQTPELHKKAPIQVHKPKIIRCVPRALGKHLPSVFWKQMDLLDPPNTPELCPAWWVATEALKLSHTKAPRDSHHQHELSACLWC